MAGSSLFQTKALLAYNFFNCSFWCSQFVSMMHGVSMQFKGSLEDPL